MTEITDLETLVLHEIQKDSDDESDDDKKKKKTEDTNLGDFEIVGDLPVRFYWFPKKEILRTHPNFLFLI